MSWGRFVQVVRAEDNKRGDGASSIFLDKAASINLKSLGPPPFKSVPSQQAAAGVHRPEHTGRPVLVA
jgi:hypothetical protein